MPVYEYECPVHGKFDTWKPMAERHLALCPECGKASKKLMSACNWSFGWRISDRSMNEKWAPRDELVRNI